MMLELTFCKSGPLPHPLLPRSHLPLLLRAMALDRLITPRDIPRVLQPLAMVKSEKVGLELLESVAPSQLYRIFRWLRGFCGERDTGEIALNALIPHVSTVLALSRFTDRVKEGLRVKVPKRAPRSLVTAVSSIAGSLGAPVEIEQCDEELAFQEWRTPPAVDLISHALGEAAAVGRDVLIEIMESGGAMVGRALLDLLGSERRAVLRLLVAFDFLRPYVTGGGLMFALTQKALEVIS